MTNLVTIPTKHYVGLVQRTNKLPLAFMTPWGTDKAAQKRMDSVNRWSGKRMDPVVVDNHPLIGFRITSDIRTTDYGGSDRWKIEDPRGFELEISSGNLAQLLSVGSIDKGEILDSCVWARSGQQNILLSTSTKEYQDAVDTTKIKSTSTSWKDVEIGNKITLQNTVKGIYLGTFLPVVMLYQQSKIESNGNVLSWDKKPVRVVLDIATNKLVFISNIKLSSIDSLDTITKAEAESIANDQVHSGQLETKYTWDKVCFLQFHDRQNPVEVEWTLALEPKPVPQKNVYPRATFLVETDHFFGEYQPDYHQATGKIYVVNKHALLHGNKMVYNYRKIKTWRGESWNEKENHQVKESDIKNCWGLQFKATTGLGTIVCNEI